MAENQILLAQNLFRQIRRCHTAETVTQIRRVLHQVSSGDLKSAGVKRLQSCLCDEAKVNQGDRLLFVSAEQDSVRYYAFLDYCAHDDAVRRAKRYQSEFLRAVFDGAEGKMYCVPQRFLPDQEAFRRWLESPEQALEILLTDAQRAIVRNTAITRIEGAAGTGKTTVLIHALRERLLRAPALLALYVTFSERLLHEARSSAEAFDDEFRDRVEFLTVKDAMARLSGLSVPPFSRREFVDWFALLPSAKRLDPMAVWAEIGGVLRGRELKLRDNRQESLDYPSYESLASSVSAVELIERREVFGVCRSYMNMLRKEGRFDALDIAGVAAETCAGARWRWIVVDEVQDVYGLELEALRRSAQRCSGELIVSGDSDQTIFPTGFRWADLVASGESAVLKMNFRCSQEIQSFAQHILAVVKANLLSVHIRNKSVRYKWSKVDACSVRSGERPMRMRSDWETVLGVLEELTGNGRIMVLARRGEVLNQLYERLGEALVDDLDEVKGLEYDCVIVCRFFGANTSFWDRVCVEGATSCNEVLNEVNRLYVAATRARESLVFVDCVEDPDVWERLEFGSMIEPVDAPFQEIVDLGAVAFTVEEWQAEGLRRERARRFRSARGAYVRANDYNGMRRCEALLKVESGDFRDAGDIWVELEQYQEGLDAYLEAKYEVGVKLCRAELFEGSEMWSDAAVLWMELGSWRRAGVAYEKGRRFDEAEMAFVQVGDAVLAAYFGRRALATLETVCQSIGAWAGSARNG